MLVCSKCGFSQIVTHRCPQCHEAWMEEKSTSHNKDYAELEKQRDELLTVGEKMLGEFEKATGYTYLPFEFLLTRIKEGE